MSKAFQPVAASASARSDAPAGDWLDVRGRISAIWQRKGLIFGCVGLGVVVALVATLFVPTLYVGRVTLLVRQSRLAESQAQPTATSLGFAALLTNSAIMDGLARDLKLDQPPFLLSRERLFNRFSVEEVRGVPLVRASFALETPEAAVAAANEFAKRAIRLNQEINEQETRQSREVVGTQRDEARIRLDAAESALLAFSQEAQLELGRRDADALLEKRTSLLGLKVEIDALRSRIEESDRQIANQSRTLSATRNSMRELDLIEASRLVDPPAAPPPIPKKGQASGEDLPQPRGTERQQLIVPMGNETINPVWEVLSYQAALGRARLQQLEREYQALVKDHGLSGAKLAVIDNLSRNELKLKRLELEREIASRVVSDLSVQYEQAKVRIASRSTELQLIDPAVSARTSKPRRSLWAAAGAFLGLAFGLAIALVLDEIRREPDAVTAPWSER
jgi:uncharacterized protein involved in exopolysaccharide biosynthesis